MKQKQIVKEEGTIHKKDEWLFNEYSSLMELHLTNANLEFDKEDLQSIKIINDQGNYRLIGEVENERYVLDVNESNIRIQAFKNNEKYFDKMLSNTLNNS